MAWLVQEILGPLARRVGGQTAAFMVGLGMAAHHESAVAAAVAWAIVTVGEVLVSHKGRSNLVKAAKDGWGRN